MDQDNKATSTPAGGIRLIEFLRDQDVACPGCQYNLRGLLSTRCPECGVELKLTVGVARQPLGAYLTLLVLSLLPAGLGILLTIDVISYGLPPRSSIRYANTLTMYITGWVCIAASISAIVLRRRIFRWSPTTQLIVCVILFINDLMLIGAFFKKINQ